MPLGVGRGPLAVTGGPHRAGGVSHRSIGAASPMRSRGGCPAVAMQMLRVGGSEEMRARRVGAVVSAGVVLAAVAPLLTVGQSGLRTFPRLMWRTVRVQ
jgi:hypothetical protein